MEINKPQLSTACLLRMSEQLGVPLNQIVPTIELFDEGATVPFIARYRKESTMTVPVITSNENGCTAE